MKTKDAYEQLLLIKKAIDQNLRIAGYNNRQIMNPDDVILGDPSDLNEMQLRIELYGSLKS